MRGGNKNPKKDKNNDSDSGKPKRDSRNEGSRGLVIFKKIVFNYHYQSNTFVLFMYLIGLVGLSARFLYHEAEELLRVVVSL